jgi:hypothetical protein
MAEFLSDTGCEVILVDNASTYPPLLEWYESCPFKVYRLKENRGHMAVWDAGIINEFSDQYYAVTDPDLELSGVPRDYLDVLMKGLVGNSEVTKAGLSLRIDDLPANAFTAQILAKEEKYWLSDRDPNGFYVAGVDTTFAVYDRERQLNERFYWALRAPEPYIARHLPWYLTRDNLTLEELFYLVRATDVSTFTRIFRENFGI